MSKRWSGSCAGIGPLLLMVGGCRSPYRSAHAVKGGTLQQLSSVGIDSLQVDEERISVEWWGEPPSTALPASQANPTEGYAVPRGGYNLRHTVHRSLSTHSEKALRTDTLRLQTTATEALPPTPRYPLSPLVGVSWLLLVIAVSVKMYVWKIKKRAKP